MLHPALENIILESCIRKEQHGSIVINGETYPIAKGGYVNPPLPDISPEQAINFLLELIIDKHCEASEAAALIKLISGYGVEVAYALRCYSRDVGRQNPAELLFAEWLMTLRQEMVDAAEYIEV